MEIGLNFFPQQSYFLYLEWEDCDLPPKGYNLLRITILTLSIPIFNIFRLSILGFEFKKWKVKAWLYTVQTRTKYLLFLLNSSYSGVSRRVFATWNIPGASKQLSRVVWSGKDVAYKMPGYLTCRLRTQGIPIFSSWGHRLASPVKAKNNSWWALHCIQEPMWPHLSQWALSKRTEYKLANNFEAAPAPCMPQGTPTPASHKQDLCICLRSKGEAGFHLLHTCPYSNQCRQATGN